MEKMLKIRKVLDWFEIYIKNYDMLGTDFHSFDNRMIEKGKAKALKRIERILEGKEIYTEKEKKTMVGFVDFLLEPYDKKVYKKGEMSYKELLVNSLKLIAEMGILSKKELEEIWEQ